MCEKLNVAHEFAAETLRSYPQWAEPDGNTFQIPEQHLRHVMALLTNLSAKARKGRQATRERLSAPVVSIGQDREFYSRLLQGSVYFFSCEGFIKIGFSDNPVDRIRQARVNNPFRVDVLGVIPGTREDEKTWHRDWSHLHHRGEWFRADDALLAEIRKCAKSPEKSPELNFPIRRSAIQIKEFG